VAKKQRDFAAEYQRRKAYASARLLRGEINELEYIASARGHLAQKRAGVKEKEYSDIRSQLRADGLTDRDIKAATEEWGIGGLRNIYRNTKRKYHGDKEIEYGKGTVGGHLMQYLEHKMMQAMDLTGVEL
jgi:hypothetical protein